MIKVTVGNNMSRKPVIVPETTTLAEAAAQAGIDFTGRTVQLNGCIVTDMSKTFSEYGIAGGEAWLLSVAKLENA